MSEEKPWLDRKADQVILLPIGIGGICLRSWVLAKLWLWTLVPLGVPAISGYHAFALYTLIGLVRYNPRDDTPVTNKWFIAALLAPPIALGSAWLALKLGGL